MTFWTIFSLYVTVIFVYYFFIVESLKINVTISLRTVYCIFVPASLSLFTEI